ncbi:4-methylaminobutanoate oxidase (formaldehyde-forming) (plasmid) [Antarctobacter heliothermus]|uniref:4-methylaminobutanoate oxidase (Formaldehyde-forming) n=1 Tax=Antarctobacter heliothermus TaxID=74033 RepID=A0A222EBD0_9RHOB|nr:FAD-binding oxidoreductase [Antarctobacter heliothermus]ASP23495.1 4-methylaminobutanoate oxidase (formaldehyde-forming) [Antarctobacter heliothermus]
MQDSRPRIPPYGTSSKSVVLSTADVVIVGGGIIGCWTALRLAEAGQKVTVIERSEIGHEGSGRNRGNVRVQLREAAERALIERSLNLWQEIEDTARKTVEYRVTGNLLVSYDATMAEDFCIEAEDHRALGYDAHVVEGDDLRALVPGLSQEVPCGFLTTQDGHVNGQLATWDIASRAKAAGVQFLRGVSVNRIAVDHDRVTSVLTDAGTFATGCVLVTAAGGAAPLLEPLGLKVPISLALHQILVTEKLPHVTGPYLRCASPRISFCQTAMGSLLLGLGPARTIAQGDPQKVEPEKIAAIMAETTRLVPTLAGAHVVRSWPGLFDLTPDGRAMIGPAAGVDGLWVATGFNGHGMSISPAVTESLATMMTGVTPAIPLDAFDPDRFEHPIQADEQDRPKSRVGHLGNLVAPPI